MKSGAPPGLKNELVQPRRIVAMPLDGAVDTLNTGWLDGPGTSAAFSTVSIAFYL